ncbi:MAG TPA: 2-amino-4-ketopentanoate thiolase [Thermotogaceae bacterium]|nr:2-amino-4-ketopentanoate thiolase [Thermotogaceae bacterium]
MQAKKGEWVQVYSVILSPNERAEHLPESTKKVPLEMRVKGFLINDFAKIGDIVEIETPSGRKISGKLIAINPKYIHDFGEPIPELIKVGPEVRKILHEPGRDEVE